MNRKKSSSKKTRLKRKVPKKERQDDAAWPTRRLSKNKETRLLDIAMREMRFVKHAELDTPPPARNVNVDDYVTYRKGSQVTTYRLPITN